MGGRGRAAGPRQLLERRLELLPVRPPDARVPVHPGRHRHAVHDERVAADHPAHAAVPRGDGARGPGLARALRGRGPWRDRGLRHRRLRREDRPLGAQIAAAAAEDPHVVYTKGDAEELRVASSRAERVAPRRRGRPGVLVTPTLVLRGLGTSVRDRRRRGGAHQPEPVRPGGSAGTRRVRATRLAEGVRVPAGLERLPEQRRGGAGERAARAAPPTPPRRDARRASARATPDRAGGSGRCRAGTALWFTCRLVGCSALPCAGRWPSARRPSRTRPRLVADRLERALHVAR